MGARQQQIISRERICITSCSLEWPPAGLFLVSSSAYGPFSSLAASASISRVTSAGLLKPLTVSSGPRRAGDERLERPLRLHLLPSAVRVQPVRRPGACALRPGNVHSADGWDGVLKPVVARYQGKVSRIYFRADAAFANPDVYEYLEAERIKYAIRIPTNQVLQDRISYLLKRPVGRPPNEVRRFYANFTYQAGSWTKPRRVIAKVEWHPGELVPRVGFIVTNIAARPSGSSPSTTSAARANNGSRKAKARSSGRGCRAGHSPQTRCGSSFIRSPTISATSCARWRRPNRSRTGR